MLPRFTFVCTERASFLPSFLVIGVFPSSHLRPKARKEQGKDESWILSHAFFVYLGAAVLAGVVVDVFVDSDSRREDLLLRFLSV